MRLKSLCLVLVFYVCFSLCNEEAEHVRYTNSWAVHVDDLDQESVNDIASKHGFTNRGQIGKLHGYYVFERKHEQGRGKRNIDDHTELLMAEPKVNWAQQQRVLERSKRNVISDEGHALREKRDMAVSIQDPFYKDQWYLQNIGQSSGPSGLDINVLPVWGRGYSGKGVVVSILDDGVDHTHPDLKRNYDPNASFDFNDFDEDPKPRSKDPLNCHGTRCAGEVAAEANNGICGVGVSFNASIGGIRMLDGVPTDVIEGLSLGYRSDYIDIYTCCWGPKDDGKRFGKPGFFASKSLKIGAEKGRGGKGNIFVWATGNGGLTDDDCNCDGYTTSIYTVSIGAISDHGLSTYYTETCASTIAVTFSGASHREADENKIITTDLNHKCTKTFKGTSSAAPLASGMLALVLEANPNLTWRDVQHIIVETSQKTSPLDEGWKQNGAGKVFNHKFGFGKLDTMRMVDAALNWTPVAKQRVCHDTRYDTKRNIPSSGSLILSAHTSACAGSTSEVRKLEHVQVVVTLKHRHRGDLSIVLISPSGTRSQLLKTRRNDKSTEGLTDWVFMTVHCWGEDPKGTWSLIITDNDRNTREHHVIKAKQGDLEDVARVVMDDSEKRGNWDSRVINEYERPKHAPPGNGTVHDHILKNMEDTTGELVKGNKFVELAKRKKNRKGKTKYVKAKKTHTEHAQKTSNIPTNRHLENKELANTKKHKYFKNWHKNIKHKKRSQKYHSTSHTKHQKHFHHKKKGHRVNFHRTAKHKQHTNKNKSGQNIGEKLGKKALKSSHLKNKKTRNSDVTSKQTNDNASGPGMADGSLEIPPGSPPEAKHALQALANPLIEKIIGITKSAHFLPNNHHHSLVGEVNIKMKLFGNGATPTEPILTKKESKNAESTRSSVQHEHHHQKMSKTTNTGPTNDLYVKLLRAIKATSNNTQEEPDIKESITNINNNIDNSGQMINSTQGNNDKKFAELDNTPLIFYDADSKKYVALTKGGANTSPFVDAREGSGGGDTDQERPEESSEVAESSESLLNDTINCGEPSNALGDCLNNSIGDYLNNNLEDENEEKKSKWNDNRKNPIQPEDNNAGRDGNLPGSSLKRNGTFVMNDFSGNEDHEAGSKLTGNGALSMNGHTESKGHATGSQLTQNDSIFTKNYTKIDEHETGNTLTENMENGMNDFAGSNKYQRYIGPKIPVRNNLEPPLTENKYSSNGSKSIGKTRMQKKVVRQSPIKNKDLGHLNSGTENTGTGNELTENNANNVTLGDDVALSNSALERDFEDSGPSNVAPKDKNERDEKRKEKAPKDDFGAVKTNDITGSAGPKPYHISKNNGNEAASNISESFDEDIMKARFEAEYGRIDNRTSDENSENYFPKNGTFLSDITRRGSRNKQNDDPMEGINEPSGNEISGSGSDAQIGSGFESVYGFSKDQIGDTMVRMNDDITNSVSDDITDGVVQSRKKNYKSHGTNSLGSGEEAHNSGDGKLSQQDKLSKESSQRTSSPTKSSQELKRKPVRLEYQNKIPRGTPEGTESSMELSRATTKGASQDQAPIKVLPNKTQNDAPEGSSSGLDPSQDITRGLSSNTVYADSSTVTEPTQKQNNSTDETNLSQNQEEQTNQGVSPETLAAYVPNSAPLDNVPQGAFAVPEKTTISHYDDYQEPTSNDDSQREERNLEATEQLPEQQQPDNGFLRRLKQDIKQRNIDDLEQIESEVKDEMKKAMNTFDDDSSESLFKDIMSNQIPNIEEEVSSPRLVRRDSIKAPPKDLVPTNEHSPTVVTNNNANEQSGILESWSLIFYGT